ncbi:MAG TPA: PAS domain S-box protein, partial [Noviherbaspirillum sp.]
MIPAPWLPRLRVPAHGKLRPGFRAALSLSCAGLVLATPLLPPILLGAAASVVGLVLWAATARAQQPEAEDDSGATVRQFRSFVEHSLVGLYVAQDGRMVHVNASMAETLGYDTPQQVIGMPVATLTAAEDLARLEENHRRHLGGEVDSVRYTYRGLRRDGARVWLDVHGGVCTYHGRPAVMGVALDVSRQMESAHQSRLASRVFECASEGIVITDADCRIEAVNPAFTRITRYPAEEATGKLSRMMTGQGARMNQGMLARLAEKGHWEGEMRDRRKSGDWYPAWLSISTVRDGDGKITNYVGVFTDNTRRKEAEARLQFLANHDTLTGMLNRSGMDLRFAEALEEARYQQCRLALLFVDLDRFK